MGKAQSQLSLIDRIKALKTDIIVTNRCNSEFNKANISEEEENKKIETIIKDFYKKNPLSYEVAAGKNSYAEMVKPIIEKYNSFWKRIFPKRDKKFDGEVERVIKSMSNIAINIEPHHFTTKGNKEYINKRIMESLFISAFICGMPLVIQSFSYWNSQDAELALPKAVEYIKFATPFFVGLYSLFMIKANSSIKHNINELKGAAKEIDKYLREHYAKYVE